MCDPETIDPVTPINRPGLVIEIPEWYGDLPASVVDTKFGRPVHGTEDYDEPMVIEDPDCYSTGMELAEDVTLDEIAAAKPIEPKFWVVRHDFQVKRRHGNVYVVCSCHDAWRVEPNQPVDLNSQFMIGFRLDHIELKNKQERSDHTS